MKCSSRHTDAQLPLPYKQLFTYTHLHCIHITYQQIHRRPVALAQQALTLPLASLLARALQLQRAAHAQRGRCLAYARHIAAARAHGSFDLACAPRVFFTRKAVGYAIFRAEQPALRNLSQKYVYIYVYTCICVYIIYSEWSMLDAVLCGAQPALRSQSQYKHIYIHNIQ